MHTRFIQALRGDMPRVHSIGILAAQKPLARGDEGALLEEDLRPSRTLHDDLRTYSCRQIKGQFGNLKNPYVVINLTREKLTALGVRYGQEAVIYGWREEEVEKLTMTFDFIDTQSHVGHVQSARCVQAARQGRQETKRERRARQAQGGDAPPDLDGFAEEERGCRFVIPFFDEDYEVEEWRGGKVLGYRRADLPAEAAIQQAADAVTAAEEHLLDSQRRPEPAQYQYVRRGALNERLNELHRLMGDYAQPPLPWERLW